MKKLLITSLVALILGNFYINLVEVPYYTEINILSVLVVLLVKHIIDKYEEVLNG